MKKKVIQWIAMLSLGKELSLALTILNILAQLTGKVKGLGLAKLTYANLPPNWKFPNGPATEDEFLEVIQSGQVFLQKIKTLITR